MVGKLFGFLHLEQLERDLRLAGQRLGSAGIDLQRLVESRGRLGPVEFLQQQLARLLLDVPGLRVFLQCIAVHVVENKGELIGERVGVGIFDAGFADDGQFFGVLDVLVGVAAFRVSADEPAKGLVGLLDLGSIAVELRLDPTGQ